jgi:hypothetical protein
MAIRQLSDGNPLGTTMGQDTSDPISFYGVAGITQRAAAAQATTAIASSTDFTAAHLAALQECMNTFIALGLWKGSA